MDQTFLVLKTNKIFWNVIKDFEKYSILICKEEKFEKIFFFGKGTDLIFEK